MTADDDTRTPTEPSRERPSKSARKRAADSLQELGVELAALPDEELEALELPESLVAALRELRRLDAHGARLRQRQYIGKLMRKIDPAPLAARLDERKRAHDRDVRAFQQIERWRDRLLRDESGALDELSARHPGVDRQALADLVARARREREAGRPPAAARALFDYLRRCLE